MLTGRPWIATVALAAVLAAAVGHGAAEEPKYQPLKVSIRVKGLEAVEAQIAFTGELYNLEAVEAVDALADRVTITVKPEKTLALADVVKAAKTQSTGEVRLVVDTAAVALVGTCGLTLTGLGTAKDDAIAKALGGAPNADKATGAGAKWTVTFTGSRGATVGEVSKALAEGLGTRPGGSGTAPAVGDVTWTAPKAPPVEGSKGCGGGCGPGRR